MLYDANGTVARSSGRAIRADRQPEAEAEVREKLKSIDELLDIRYVEWAGRYSLVCKWPQIDPRWKMYQAGEIGEPYDSLGWFCTDMQDPQSIPVSVDSIEQLVMERLASCDNTQSPWKDRMRQVIDKNAKVREARKQAVADRAEDIAGSLFDMAGRVDAHKFERILEEVAQGKV